MSRKTAGFFLAATAGVVIVGGFRTFARAQETPPAPSSPCHEVAGQPARAAGALNAVARYGSTYVLVISERLSATVPDAKAPAVSGLHVVAESGSAADAARAIGITNVTEFTWDPAAPFQALQDVAAGKADAAVLWAPLAGLGVLELGMGETVSMFSIDRPHQAPPSLRAAAAAAGPCSLAVQEELDVNGVLPAELLVPVEIRTLLNRRPPPFNVEEARQGAPVFNEVCARCHGADAVADPHGLAPVDLRLSIRRFSYPGFSYIVLNGRPERSMPPLRGTVTDEQIRLIYQYLKARSNRVLTSANDNVHAQNNPHGQEGH